MVYLAVPTRSGDREGGAFETVGLLRTHIVCDTIDEYSRRKQYGLTSNDIHYNLDLSIEDTLRGFEEG